MPLYIGSKRVKDLYIGSTKIKELYCGSTKVYSASAPGPVPGTVIFESSTPGTYTVTIPATGNYEIWMVGGGAGGFPTIVSGKQAWMGGASGGYIHGTTKLSAGAYEAVVSPESSIVIGGVYSYTDTTFANQIAKAAAGDCTVTLSGLTATKGNLGTTSTTTGTGGASVYGGYGKGGDASKSSRQNGTPGYLKIVAA